MQAITSRNGGVDPRHLDTLQRMFRREEQLERRLVLMTILKQSPPETLRGAVAGQKVVAELQKWLQSAVETKEYRLASRVIETLDRLPIDLATFQVSVPPPPPPPSPPASLHIAEADIPLHHLKCIVNASRLSQKSLAILSLHHPHSSSPPKQLCRVSGPHPACPRGLSSIGRCVNPNHGAGHGCRRMSGRKGGRKRQEDVHGKGPMISYYEGGEGERRLNCEYILVCWFQGVRY